MSGGTQQVTWERPGPGTWVYDGSHAPPNSTRIYQELTLQTFEPGQAQGFATYGAPLAGLQARFVRGKFYRRLVPLIGGDRDMRPPPAFVLWLVTRLHPAFRERERRARRTFAERTYRKACERWFERERQEWIDGNLALQDIDPASLADAALAEHIVALRDHVIAGGIAHHVLHAADLGPIGDLLAHTNRWGLPAAEVAAALAGASPATTEAVDLLGRLAAHVAKADERPRTLDDVRALGADAAELLDEYLRHYGWRLVTSYDLEGSCLAELPDVVLATIAAAGEARAHGDGTAAVAALRERVPEADRERFDELMAEARYVYGVRDDNGPLTFEWPAGLLRRSVLEAGRRLTAAGRVESEADVWELELDEIVAMVRGGPGPDGDEIRRRADERREWATDDPPLVLGPPEEPPPVHVLPRGLARATEPVLAIVEAIEVKPDHRWLEGTGIGTEAYTGRARVAERPEEVLVSMEPGDVLVARFTAPTYNAVLAVAGAVVTEMGGPMSHAAVMARELGIPAVIGAAGAMTAIGDGDMVRVDPMAGKVTVL